MLRLPFVLLVTLASTASAVTQPDGTVIPLTTRVESFVNGSPNNDNLDEGIAAQAEARVQPETFSPLCGFTAKYVAKGGGANFAFGWYNVDDTRPNNMPPRYVPVDTGANLNTAAASSDVFILFPFSSSLPPMRDLTGVSITTHPRYLQGRIGFVLIPNPNGTGSANATQYHYTEHRYNVRCNACAVPGPWYSSLLFPSKLLPNTFYLGFEDLDFVDLPGSAGINGNDLDYDDFLFRISGVRCLDAGKYCELGTAQGLCRRGLTECDAAGQSVCRPLTQPNTVTETCDGQDEDCDGLIDEGVTCAMGKTCDRGRCVDPCGPAAPCGGTRACVGGRCVESSCQSVTCADGTSCHQGTCSDPCTGIVCPASRVCRNGACVDPCGGVTCPADQVCDRGVCVISCACTGCASQNVCQASGLCVAATAACSATCSADQACVSGQCTDRCANTVCPIGETCTAGECVALPPPPCDDGNPCTTDSRDPVMGCIAVPVTDGLACTGSTCSTGMCAAGVCSCPTGGGGGAASGGGGGGELTGGGGGAMGGGTATGGGEATGGGSAMGGGSAAGGGGMTGGGTAAGGGAGGGSPTGSGCGCGNPGELWLGALASFAVTLLRRRRYSPTAQ